MIFGMCGRFTAKNPNLIKKRFEEFDLHGPSMPARYNIGPAQLLFVISINEQGKPGAKEMKWGLVPFWDKSEKPRIAPINAKSEEVLTKRVFSQPLQKRRCLVPADGFYEWKKLRGELKEPHHIQLKNGEPFFFAGVYERGGDERPDTFAMLTTAANDLMKGIHVRMPVILYGEMAHAWLGSGPISQEELSRLSAPYPATEMEEWAVGEAVGNVKNEGPELVVPVVAGAMIAERASGEQLSLL